MAKTYVLDRVAADLSRGFTHPAIQRLSSLVAAYPTDLDLRRRLAALHRTVGNRVQAGRWDYLTIGASADDTSAFERAFPSAVARLREVRWPRRASLAATVYARSRLDKLVAAAEAERKAVALARAQRAAARADRDGARPTRSRLVSARVDGYGMLASRAWHGVLSRVTFAASSRPARLAIAVVAMPAAFFAILGAATVLEWIIR
jgi:hypothetical protein